MKISAILDKIDEHQLFVPAFQREYVWKRDDAKELLDSLIKDYPTGTMLTWETDNPPELKGTHRYSANQGSVRILLDGQQRVTTLYLLVRGKTPPYYSEAEITHNIRGLYVNLETRELEYYSMQKMERDPLWRDITDVFQKKVRAREVYRELEAKGETLDRDREDRIENTVRAVELILDREFPEQTIPIKASIRDAIEIFYKVNASGVALTDAELALAQISGYWPEARDKFKKKLAEFGEGGFVLKLDFVVYALLACLYSSGSDLRKLHGPENKEGIKEAWSRLETQVLDYVANLLKAHAYVDHTGEINSPYALIPIIAFCYWKQGRHLTEAEIGKVVKWFYYSQVRARYVSQLPQKLDRDLRTVAESQSPFDELLNVIAEERPLRITPGEFEGATTRNALYGLMTWYFKSKGALCFTTGVSIRRNMGRKYQLESDHLFPYSKLKAAYDLNNRYNYALAQELTNRAILTLVANRTKSATDAESYLAEVRERFPSALKLQSIPEDPELWKIDRFKDFLAARRALLADQLNDFLEGIAITAEPTAEVSIADLIADGESDELEFKQSMRWDYQEGRLNRLLEEVVAKTVAAFANSQGGILLIGVDDEGRVVGLDHDYETLDDADSDKYERHLRQVLSNAYGAAFVSSKVRISFPAVDDVEICRLEIDPANEPLITKARDRNGQPVEKFYVRSGNSSNAMSMSEAQRYIRERFAA